mgnify:CR=1 FL=1
MQNNTARTLEGLYHVKAWQTKIENEKNKFALNIHVRFDEAEMGGDADTSPASFILRLRRAEVVAIMPKGGKYEVDPASIITEPVRQFEREQTTTTTKSKSGSGKINDQGISIDSVFNLSQS